ILRMQSRKSTAISYVWTSMTTTNPSSLSPMTTMSNSNSYKALNPEMLELAREVRGLTQSDLAEKLGITQGKISKVLDGLQTFPDELIPRLEIVLHFPRSFFFRDWNYEGPPAHLFRRKLTL